MFGHGSSPTRIYRYGASVPTQALDVIEEQLYLVHRYRNALVALEQHRRQQVADVLRGAMPTALAWERTEALLSDMLGCLRERLAAGHARRRKRETSATEQQAVADLRLAIRECRAHRKALKQAALARDEVKAALDQVSADTVAEGKRLRASSRLAWGNYLVVEQGMQAARSGPPPRFHRWDGTGKLAVQLQKGLSVEALHAMQDTRLQLSAPGTRRSPNGTIRGHDRMVTCRFRIGSVGRAPLWAEIPVVMHRPLPEGAVVKWAYLQVKRVATHRYWELLIVISHPQGFPKDDAATTGVVGIDPGYRLRPHGLRVAYWVGSDGAQAEWVIPQKRLDAWTWVHELASLRTLRFNAARTQLVAWTRTMTEVPADWWEEATATLAHWRSPAKLVGLVWRWKAIYEAREPWRTWLEACRGDDLVRLRQRLAEACWPSILHALEAWRQWDKRRYEEQEHLRRKLLNWRDNAYRQWIAELRRRYHTAVLEKADWAQMAREVEPEAPKTIPDAVDRYRVIAAPGRLCQLIKEGMVEVLDGPAAYSTQLCPACHRVQPARDPMALHERCRGCGTLWDQDQKAATTFSILADRLRERLGDHASPQQPSRVRQRPTPMRGGSLGGV